MGPRGSGFIPSASGRRRRSTTAGPARPTSRASATSRTSTPTSSAAITSRAAAAPASTRAWPTTCPASARPSSRTCASTTRRLISLGGLRRGAAAQGEPRLPRRRASRTPGAFPVLRFDYHVRRQREEDGQGHGRHGRGDAARRGRGEHQGRPRACSRRAGPSTRSAPRAWATTRRRRSPNKWCRLHDVSNVYMADAAPVRLRRHAEHHLVDPRHVLADDGLPQGADADGRASSYRPTLSTRSKNSFWSSSDFVSALTVRRDRTRAAMRASVRTWPSSRVAAAPSPA